MIALSLFESLENLSVVPRPPLKRSEYSVSNKASFLTFNLSFFSKIYCVIFCNLAYILFVIYLFNFSTIISLVLQLILKRLRSLLFPSTWLNTYIPYISILNIQYVAVLCRLLKIWHFMRTPSKKLVQQQLRINWLDNFIILK